MVKRIFDIVFSLTVFSIILLPTLFIALLIALDSRGGIFYLQKRIGKQQIPFNIIKFRTMKPDSDSKGLLTVGSRDSRVTKVGYFLRKYKLDELPQIINVLFGDMSIVGPRPEVEKYVKLYSQAQLKVLNVKPGLTDFASIYYINENEILNKSKNPEETYIQEIMPAKLELGLKYVETQSLFLDIKIIIKTAVKIFSKKI